MMEMMISTVNDNFWDETVDLRNVILSNWQLVVGKLISPAKFLRDDTEGKRENKSSSYWRNKFKMPAM